MTEPVVTDEPGRVIVEFPLGDLEPGVVWEWLTTRRLITRWWAEEAELDLRVGGAYLVSWPSQGWVLRGTYSEVDPPSRLGFSWA